MNRMTLVVNFAVAIVLATNLAAVAQTPVPKDVDPAAQIEKLKKDLRQMSLDLSEAKGVITTVKEKTVRERLSRSIARMEQRCEDMSRQLSRIRFNPPVAIPIVSEPELAKFIEALRALSFDDKKATALKQYVPFQNFTCGQTVRLVKQFSFGDGQTQAAIMLYPRLVDPQNFYQVLAAMTFESDRDRVRKALKMQ